jgi:Sulfatase
LQDSFLKRYLGCLGFANLCTLNLWHDSQRLQQEYQDYFRAEPAGHTMVAGILLVILTLSVTFYVIVSIGLRITRPRVALALRAALMLAFLFPIYLLDYVVLSCDFAGHALLVAKTVTYLGYAGVLLAVVLYVIVRKEKSLRVLLGVNRALVPLLVVSVAGYVWVAYRQEKFSASTRYVSRAGIRRARPSDRPRILWVLFDEFDYNLGFVSRPPSVSLAEFDRLRRESFAAENAFPAASETLLAMPSLISGLPACGAQVVGHSALSLCRENGSKNGPWLASETLFAGLRSQGSLSGVVSWYHPSCRLFPETLAACEFVPATQNALLVHQAYATQVGAVRFAWYLLRSQASLLPLIPRTIVPGDVDLGRLEQLSEFEKVHAAALKYVVDPGLDFVMVHYPIPHPHGIYDRRAKRFSSGPEATYLDNLALADRTLGEIRRALESSGQWVGTALIVSSDHSLRAWSSTAVDGRKRLASFGRTGLERIPFIVRLPGQTSGVSYEPRVNTLLTAALILAIDRGEISTFGDLENWLTKH